MIILHVSLLWNFMMLATACFIHLSCANDHHWFIISGWLSIDYPLRARCWFSAYHTNCLQLIHMLSLGHQYWYRAKWLTPKVGIQTSHDYPQPVVSQPLHNVDDLVIKELGFIYGYNSRISLKMSQYLSSLFNRVGFKIIPGM